jgi:hypothetical protein
LTSEITNHGQPGYRRGCHCSVCREGHRLHNAAWRAGRKRRELAEASGAPLIVEVVREPLASVPALDMACAAGPIEAALLADIAEPDEAVAWRRHLVLMGRLNARVLDQIGKLDRLDLVSGIQLRQLEILSRLAILGFKGMTDNPAGATPVADDAEELLRQMAGEGESGSGRQA